MSAPANHRGTRRSKAQSEGRYVLDPVYDRVAFDSFIPDRETDLEKEPVTVRLPSTFSGAPFEIVTSWEILNAENRPLEGGQLWGNEGDRRLQFSKVELQENSTAEECENWKPSRHFSLPLCESQTATDRAFESVGSFDCAGMEEDVGDQEGFQPTLSSIRRRIISGFESECSSEDLWATVGLSVYKKDNSTTPSQDWTSGEEDAYDQYVRYDQVSREGQEHASDSMSS